MGGLLSKLLHNSNEQNFSNSQQSQAYTACALLPGENHAQTYAQTAQPPPSKSFHQKAACPPQKVPSLPPSKQPSYSNNLRIASSKQNKPFPKGGESLLKEAYHFIEAELDFETLHNLLKETFNLIPKEHDAIIVAELKNHKNPGTILQNLCKMASFPPQNFRTIEATSTFTEQEIAQYYRDYIELLKYPLVRDQICGAMNVEKFLEEYDFTLPIIKTEIEAKIFLHVLALRLTIKLPLQDAKKKFSLTLDRKVMEAAYRLMNKREKVTDILIKQYGTPHAKTNALSVKNLQQEAAYCYAKALLTAPEYYYNQKTAVEHAENKFKIVISKGNKKKLEDIRMQQNKLSFHIQQYENDSHSSVNR